MNTNENSSLYQTMSGATSIRGFHIGRMAHGFGINRPVCCLPPGNYTLSPSDQAQQELPCAPAGNAALAFIAYHDNLTVFEDLLEITGLRSALEPLRQYDATIFAPSDQAFQQLFQVSPAVTFGLKLTYK